MQRSFHIIGVGMGTAQTLTGEARDALACADRVLSSSARFNALCAHSTVCTVGAMAQTAIADGADTTAILVSGDVGFYSMAATLADALRPHGDVVLHSGISSLQYFTAKLGVPYQDVFVLSLHGRAGSVLGAVSHHERVFALTGGAQSPQSICGELTQAGLGDCTVCVGEHLGAERERVVRKPARELQEEAFASLAVVLICNDAPANPFAPIRDGDILRSDVPMTKADIRHAVLGRLPIAPRDTVWDIGAGTGAMTVALARRAYLGAVHAVERHEHAVQLVRENRARFGAYHIHITHAEAPDGLEDLPAPDHVFVGGAGGNLEEILRVALAKNPRATIAITAIALESALTALQTLERLGVKHIACTQLAASHGKQVAGYTMMLASNPIFIISGGEQA